MLKVKSTRSPLVYAGGKDSISRWVVEHINMQSKTYIDVFGGGASILLAKPTHEVEVYNDSGFASLFFALLRHDVHGPRLLDKLRLTPFSEDEFHYCRINWKEESDPVEQCRMWFVQINYGFTHQEDSYGWIGVGKQVNQTRSIRNHVDIVPSVVERLKQVAICNRDFRHVFSTYDYEDAIFYCDPPYISGNEDSLSYRQTMTLRDHEDLMQIITSCKGKVLLSGYTNELYERYLKDWWHDELTRNSMVHNNEQLAKGVQTRTEHLWSNYDPSKVEKLEIKTNARKEKEVSNDLWSDWT